MIKLLDCTLRDGGYINDWRFGSDLISRIVNELDYARVDFIECGFISNIKYNPDVSLFDSFLQLNKFHTKQAKLALMLNYGELELDSFSSNLNSSIEIRLAFKKHQLNDIYDFVSGLNDLNIPCSLNPMHIGLYSEKELYNLSEITNKLKPVCLTAVDTMGILYPDSVKTIFNSLNSSVNESIPFGFHSHNNLNLSYQNIKSLIDLGFSRDIIIDTTLAGIGRGGGMPRTEIIAKLLNEFKSDIYDITSLNNLSEFIKHNVDIPQNKYPYYLSAKYKCHPNYAAYMIKKDFSDSQIEHILSKIPEENKIIYEEKIIEYLCE